VPWVVQGYSKFKLYGLPIVVYEEIGPKLNPSGLGSMVRYVGTIIGYAQY